MVVMVAQTMWMYLMPLNCTLKCSEDGKFYVMYILSLFFKIKNNTFLNSKIKIQKIFSCAESF